MRLGRAGEPGGPVSASSRAMTGSGWRGCQPPPRGSPSVEDPSSGHLLGSSHLTLVWVDGHGLSGGTAGARALAASEGEGPFALWHFSEDPTLGVFRPHVPATNLAAPPLVWAVDTRHAPMFWFPRDCPRGCIWPVSTTTPEDQERFFGQSGGGRVHVIEGAWLRGRPGRCRLYAYRLPLESFRPHEEVGGYWVADQEVEAAERVVVDDLLGMHVEALHRDSGSPRRSGLSGVASPRRPSSSAARGWRTPLRIPNASGRVP